MARADLLYDIIKYGLNNDNINFRKAVEAICAEERAKQHGVLANRIEEILHITSRMPSKDMSMSSAKNSNANGDSLVTEKIPVKKLKQLLLPKSVIDSCNELIEEHLRADLLRSYGLEPRNKLLLIGPPGNGKTSLAEAIAESLMLPFHTVKYESLVGSYLGETALRLAKLFEYVKTRQCILFFDEFETLGKERGDIHETGEIKRVVSSLLLQIDSLPSYVIVIAATNHETLLDKAAWRRFQIRLTLPKPTHDDLQVWFEQFEHRTGFDFGFEPSTLAKMLSEKSYAEAEEFALSVYRQSVLKQPECITKDITQTQLALLNTQAKNTCDLMKEASE
ncbi:MAG: AAA family ATPase [Oscillospiraceae bacterium]|nr:AAA family ATPase [Oscillospiraceae bacterium]